MRQIVEIAGMALLGGVAALAAGLSFEFVRAMINAPRRREILARSWRENLYRLIH